MLPRTITITFITCLILSANAHSATRQQSKMAQLAFMVGNWVGNSKSYGAESTTEIPAYETIQYKVDQSLITIDLLSESLKLHTVIYYDEDANTYFYCPFYKNGAGKYRGEVKDGKFLVSFSETRRLVFQRTQAGQFQEYGEKRVDGKWQKYFEDTFNAM